ncbi:MAG: peptidase S1, partial [Polaromonas sp.]|nr:peptidase S1 [Polaromonas sp.]
MRRPARYSSSSRPTDTAREPPAAVAAPATTSATRFFSASNPRLLWSALLVLTVLLCLSLALSLRPMPRKLTQEDINAAVLKTLETTQLPSAVAKAYE